LAKAELSVEQLERIQRRIDRFRQYLIESDKDDRQRHRLLAYINRVNENMQRAIQFYNTNKEEGDPEDEGEEIDYKVTQGQCMKCGNGTVDLYPMTLQFTRYLSHDVEVPVKLETKFCKACLNEEYKHFYHYTAQYKLGREKR
jgi:hypothetical protein